MKTSILLVDPNRNYGDVLLKEQQCSSSCDVCSKRNVVPTDRSFGTIFLAVRNLKDIISMPSNECWNDAFVLITELPAHSPPGESAGLLALRSSPWCIVIYSRKQRKQCSSLYAVARAKQTRDYAGKTMGTFYRENLCPL